MMRYPLLPALSALLFLTGCAGHFYREEADRVHLYLKEGRAAEVLFASSLDGFEPHRAEKTGSNTWKITVPKAEEFRYFYWIDGRVYLPDCPQRELDDFGSYDCLYKAGR